MFAARIPPSILFALVALFSLSAWAQPAESQRCLDSEPTSEEYQTNLAATLTGGDTGNGDTNDFGADIAPPTGPFTLPDTCHYRSRSTELTSVSLNWSYWPHAPPNPVIV